MPTATAPLERWIGRCRQVGERALSPQDRALLGAALTAQQRRLPALTVGLALPLGVGLPTGLALGVGMLPEGAHEPRWLAAAVLGLAFAGLVTSFVGGFVELIDPTQPGRRVTLSVLSLGLLLLGIALFAEALPPTVGGVMVIAGASSLLGWMLIGALAVFHRAKALRAVRAVVTLLRQDAEGALVMCFEEQPIEPRPERMSIEVLARSRAVLRIGSEEVMPRLLIVPITAVDSGATTRMDAPFHASPRTGSSPDGIWRQRTLSSIERGELTSLVARDARRLAVRAMLLAYGCAVLGRLVDHWLWGGPRVGLGWRGALMALCAVVALLVAPIRRLLALRRDAHEGLVLIAAHEEGVGSRELLGASGAIWTIAGAPAAWRAPS